MTFLEDIEPSIKKLEELIGLSLKIFLTTAMVVIFMGVYIANLIYGDNSLHMLQNLQREKGMIQYEIGRLKQENAKLHKQYLEWTDAREGVF